MHPRKATAAQPRSCAGVGPSSASVSRHGANAGGHPIEVGNDNEQGPRLGETASVEQMVSLLAEAPVTAMNHLQVHYPHQTFYLQQHKKRSHAAHEDFLRRNMSILLITAVMYTVQSRKRNFRTGRTFARTRTRSAPDSAYVKSFIFIGYAFQGHRNSADRTGGRFLFHTAAYNAG